jgi:hypothetical protein
MAPDRRRQIVLGGLVLVLVGALYRALDQSTQSPRTAAARSAGRGGQTTEAVKTLEAPHVRLEVLAADRVTPTSSERNLFEFGARLPAPGPQSADREVRLPPPPQVTGGGAAALPPIALRFIGVVEATEKSETYAVLRDDRGVYHGREGDIVEGRYRILRIGAESIELAYVDGRGRQTIRLGS